MVGSNHWLLKSTKIYHVCCSKSVLKLRRRFIKTLGFVISQPLSGICITAMISVVKHQIFKAEAIISAFHSMPRGLSGSQ